MKKSTIKRLAQPPPPKEKDPAAVELGRRGGTAKAANLTAKERSAEMSLRAHQKWAKRDVVRTLLDKPKKAKKGKP